MSTSARRSCLASPLDSGQTHPERVMDSKTARAILRHRLFRDEDLVEGGVVRFLIIVPFLSALIYVMPGTGDGGASYGGEG